MKQILFSLPLLALLACGGPLDQRYEEDTWMGNVQEGSPPGDDSLNYRYCAHAIMFNQLNGIDSEQFTCRELIDQGRKTIDDKQVKQRMVTLTDSLRRQRDHEVDSTKQANGFN